MTHFSNHEVDQAKNLARALYDLRQLDQQVKEDIAAACFNASIEDRIAQWLCKVREIARVYKPADYAITLGVPFGLSVSFTWSPQD